MSSVTPIWSIQQDPVSAIKSPALISARCAKANGSRDDTNFVRVVMGGTAMVMGGTAMHRNVAHLLFGEKTVAITQIGDSMGTPLNIARGIVLGTSVTRR